MKQFFKLLIFIVDRKAVVTIVKKSHCAVQKISIHPYRRDLGEEGFPVADLEEEPWALTPPPPPFFYSGKRNKKKSQKEKKLAAQAKLPPSPLAQGMDQPLLSVRPKQFEEIYETEMAFPEGGGS